MKKDNLNEISPKVRIALMSLINDFYSIEKQHTVVVMPFFGLLHIQGNESKPLLNHVDINILDLMKSQFKDVIVYPGENNYLSSYGLPLSSVEHLVYEQNIFSRIANKTTSFCDLSEKHNEILYLYEQALINFETMKEECPLPYKTAFSIKTPEDLMSYVKQLDRSLKQENKDNKVCLVCPITYLLDHDIETYILITETMKSIRGILYFAQNQSDIYLYDNSYRLLYDDQYEEKFIHSIQDFANTYNADITKLAKDKIQFNYIIQQIKEGRLGTTESEIIDKLNRIDIQKIYSTQTSNEKSLH